MSKLYSRAEIEAAKEMLRIPELWRHLVLPGEPKASCRSPFRKERRASFSIFDQGRRAKDHGTGEIFDAISFLAKACELSSAEAVVRFVEMAGGRANGHCSIVKQDSLRQESGEHPRAKPDVSKLREPTDAEIEEIARDRGGLSPAGLEMPRRLHCLRYGDVCGYRSWILTDPRGLNAEARRFQRLNYPLCGEISERKAHTIRGSVKSWPIGAGVDRSLLEKASLIAVVEGGPDLLACWDFIYRAKRWDVLPIAILGRAIHGLHPDALALLAGKRIKFFPHVDPDGGGLKQVELISKQQLQTIGCQLTYFDLTGLRTRDGMPAKDLNDLTQLDTNQLGELKDLFL